MHNIDKRTRRIGGALILGLALALGFWWQTSRYVNWDLSMEAEAESAFGASLFFGQLPLLYPETKVEILRERPLQQIAFRPHQQTAYLLISPRLPLPAYEWDELLAYVAAGNTLLVATEEAPGLWRKLSLMPEALLPADSLTLLAPASPGHWRWAQHHVGPALKRAEGLAAQPLWQTPEGQILALALPWGAGQIILSSLPRAFSNYYLIRPHTPALLQTLLPDSLGQTLFWDEWYKPRRIAQREKPPRQTGDHALWGFLWRRPSLRWGLGILLATGLLFMLFGSQRKQRAVPEDDPELRPVADHLDVIARMQQARPARLWAADWAEETISTWQRVYGLRMNPDAPQFVEGLALRWGQPASAVAPLLRQMNKLAQAKEEVREKEVWALYQAVREMEQDQAPA